MLAQFIEDRCTLHADLSAQATELYAAYTDWCGENGERAWTMTTFGLRLREKGFEKKTSGVYYYLCIGIEENEEVEGE